MNLPSAQCKFIIGVNTLGSQDGASMRNVVVVRCRTCATFGEGGSKASKYALRPARARLGPPCLTLLALSAQAFLGALAQ